MLILPTIHRYDIDVYVGYLVDSTTCTHKFVHQAVSDSMKEKWSGVTGRLSALVYCSEKFENKFI